MSQIDQDVLDQVRALQRPGGPDILSRIITVFADQTPVSVETILRAVEEKDFETVRTQAHSIKSSANYVGALAFSKRMATLEKAARDEQADVCEQLTVDLTDHCHRVVSELLFLKDRAA